MKKYGISTLITFILGALIYYFMLPAINIHSFAFWMFIIFIILIYSITYSLLNRTAPIKIIKESKGIEFTYNGSKTFFIALSSSFFFSIIVINASVIHIYYTI